MISLSINGQSHELDVSPETPLLWVVRDIVGLKGSKFGCGMGLCGACTMHLNGTAIRTCVTPVSAASGQAVTTIEGLGTPDEPHPLQDSWQQFNVPQCGYCQSGQLMSASSLLASNPKPSREDIRAAMSGNLCRCGTYPRIEQAILHASGQYVDVGGKPSDKEGGK